MHHQVFRTGREPSNYVREVDDELEAYRQADLFAEFSKANSWRQELHDFQTGECWVREPGNGWASSEAAS